MRKKIKNRQKKIRNNGKNELKMYAKIKLIATFKLND